MLYYEISGSGDTIVFLHGALVSMKMWESQVAYFKDKYQVLTIDLPEHGQSKDSVLSIYSVEMIANAVMELTKKLDIHSFNLCGHSLGGMVAQEIAIMHPELIQCLILAETSYGTKTTILERIETALAKPLIASMSQNQLVNMSKNTYGKHNEHVKNYIETEMSAYNIKQSRRVMSAAFNYESKERLRKIQNRTLILVAENNKQTHAQGKALCEQIINSKFVSIPNAHHLLNIDHPLFFNSAIEQFILSDK